jgi:probable HAF family extracellular repeat protein
MNTKEINRRRLSAKSIGFSSLLVPLLAPVCAAACGLTSSMFTNLPVIPYSGFQVNGLNATGQLAGFFYVAFQHPDHAFFYDTGTLTDLGTFGGSTSSGYAINSSGQVAGQSDLANGQTHAFLYTGGQPQDLGTLGGTSSSGSLINDAGVVAGTSTLSGSTATAGFIYTGGVMMNLGTFGGDCSPYGLNNVGVVVGECALTNGDFHAFIYAEGTLKDLGTLGGTYSAAYAVNDAGTVVGESSLANGHTNGFVYTGGAMTGIGTFGGSYSSAFALNRIGQVIGVAYTLNDQEMHGFVSTGGPLTDLGTLGGNYSLPLAINNAGLIVGQAGAADGSDHAFIYKNGQMVDLNTLLATNSGWVLQEALFINDSGRIVGIGTYNQLSQWFIMDLGSNNSAPVAVAGPDQTVAFGAQVTLDGSQSSDPDNDSLTFAWSLNGSVLGTNAIVTVSLSVGTNVITLTVTDPCGASSQANVTVQVADTIPPTILSVPTSVTVSADTNCLGAVPNVLAGVSATDNVTPSNQLALSQSPVAGTLLPANQYTITVFVTDAAGNTAIAPVPLTIADMTPPTVVTTPAPITVSANGNCQGAVPNVLPGVVATDNCTPANLLTLSQSPAAGMLLGTGQYVITVTVADAAGNKSTTGVPLTIADTTPPVIQSVTASPSVLSPPNNKPVAITVAVTASDNCDSAPVNKIVSITCNAPTAPGDIKITGALTASLVASKGPGGATRIYTITVNSTDLAGNSSLGTTTVTVPGK